MSAFLGKIHHLLYNKILLQEALYKQTLVLAEDNKIDIRKAISEAEDKFGPPIQGKLEDIIDHGNIHGYLQGCIQKVESRQAYVILQALKLGLDKDILLKLYKDVGLHYGKINFNASAKPYDLFIDIYNHLLAGMPCDRVNVVSENEDHYISWEMTTCLQAPYWKDQVDVYYELTDAFIHGFVEGASSNHIYSRAGFHKKISEKENF
jgi:hypothetical protein